MTAALTTLPSNPQFDSTLEMLMTPDVYCRFWRLEGLNSPVSAADYLDSEAKCLSVFFVLSPPPPTVCLQCKPVAVMVSAFP